MARDQRPMAEEEIEDLAAAVETLREELRDDLAADFGGDPGEYRADEALPDGGE